MFKMNRTCNFIRSTSFVLSILFCLSFPSLVIEDLLAQERVQDFIQMEVSNLEGDNDQLTLQGVPQVLVTTQYVAIVLVDAASKIKFALKIPRQSVEKIKSNLQMVKVSTFHPQFFAELSVWDEDHHHDHSFVLKRGQQKNSMVLSSYDPLNKRLKGEFTLAMDSKEHHHHHHHHGSNGLDGEDDLVEIHGGVFTIKLD